MVPLDGRRGESCGAGCAPHSTPARRGVRASFASRVLGGAGPRRAGCEARTAHLEGHRLKNSKTDALKLDCPSEKRHLLPSTNTAESGESIKRLLSNLGAIGQGLGELRNLYGTGHGPDGKAKGLSARHARLATGAAATLAAFLLETHEAREE